MRSMQYILYDGDDDVPQEIKNGLLVMTINKAIEQELPKLWEGSVGDQSGRFSIEVVVPDEWQSRFDYPEIRFKIVNVRVERKRWQRNEL